MSLEFGKLMVPEILSRKTPNVLIVDDDVDSALLIEQMFSALGCQTTCSLNSKEARQRICARKSDIIVLDWCLDRQVEGRDVLDQCAQIFTKYGAGGDKPRVITYSGLEASEIEFGDNPYFVHLGHWQKPLSHHDLLVGALSLLKKVES